MIPRALYDLVSGDSTLAGLLTPPGGSDVKFYRDEAPQGTIAPYVRYFVVFGQPFNTLDEAPEADASRIQFDIYGFPDDGGVDADAIFEAMRNVLEPYGYIVGYQTGRDPDTRSFFAMFEMTFVTGR